MGASIDVLASHWSNRHYNAILVATLLVEKTLPGKLGVGWSVDCHEVDGEDLISSPTHRFNAKAHLENVRSKGGFQYFPGY
jgi:hypothetical protein